jgi:hypothetical protein
MARGGQVILAIVWSLEGNEAEAKQADQDHPDMG